MPKNPAEIDSQYVHGLMREEILIGNENFRTYRYNFLKFIFQNMKVEANEIEQKITCLEEKIQQI